MSTDNDNNNEMASATRTLQSPSILSRFASIFRWKPTSPELLFDAEQKMLRVVETKYEQFMVKAGDQQINTLKMGQGPPLVLVHGFGGGVGFWTCNFDALAKHYTVYSIDLLGFGRSSRPKFRGRSVDDAEEFFIDNLEEWRKSVNLQDFTLLGHSLGGYITAAYALKYAKTNNNNNNNNNNNDHNNVRLRRLVLVDPFGVPRKPQLDPETEAAQKKNIPFIWRVVSKIVSMGSPLSVVRLLGPFGPAAIERFRPDFARRFGHLYDDKAVTDYIYHLSAHVPSGEVAFSALSRPFGWAANPLCERLPEMNPDIPTTFIYGEHSWMDRSAAYQVKTEMKGDVDIHVVPQAGHHVYADNWKGFNHLMAKIAKRDYPYSR